ncbi:MAG TPA: hypothetical protein VI457_08530 [Methylococcaceae bacterium]|nr:hypothetical protein [Methylococcaceae bacterium]
MIGEFALVLGAATGCGVGFELRGPLGQQAERFLGGAGQLFFEVTEVLFGMFLNEVQAGLQIVLPGGDFGGGERGLREGGGGLAGGAGSEDVLGQALALGLGGALGLADARRRAARFAGFARGGVGRGGSGGRHG